MSIHQPASKFLRLFVICLIGFRIAVGFAAADDHLLQRHARTRMQVRRFAGGLAGPESARSFRQLLADHSGDLDEADLTTAVPALDGTNFSGVRGNGVPLLTPGGRLNPPPGLIAETPNCQLGEAAGEFEQELFSVFAKVDANEPLSAENIRRLLLGLDAWEEAATVRDKQTRMYCLKLRSLVQYRLANPARRAKVAAMMLPNASLPSFPGGNVIDLVAFVSEHDLAPQPGSQAAFYLSRLAEQLASLDRHAEKEARQDRIDARKDANELAELVRTNRAKAAAARKAQQHRPQVTPRSRVFWGANDYRYQQQLYWYRVHTYPMYRTYTYTIPIVRYTTISR